MATKRLFGTSFAGFWTKKVRAFDSQLWAKKTSVFVDHIDLTQGISNQALVARQSRLKLVLKGQMTQHPERPDDKASRTHDVHT